jgi:hypothetical protein
VSVFSPAGIGAELSTHLKLVWGKGDLRLDELWTYFTRHTYLPKLADRSVLDAAVKSLPGSILIGEEAFCVAQGVEKTTGRYIDLVMPEDYDRAVQVTDATLLVSSTKAKEQRTADIAATKGEDLGVPVPPEASSDGESGKPQPVTVVDLEPTPIGNKRFFGTLVIDSVSYARDFTNLNREILDRISDSDVELEITVEIQAKKKNGFDSAVQRTVSENAKALKFKEASFEED